MRLKHKKTSGILKVKRISQISKNFISPSDTLVMNKKGLNMKTVDHNIKSEYGLKVNTIESEGIINTLRST